MSGWSREPGNSGLTRLLHEAAQTHLGGAEQLRVIALDKGRQERKEGPVMPIGLQDLLGDGIRRVDRQCAAGLAGTLIAPELEVLGVVKEPRGGDAEDPGKGCHDSDGRVRLIGLDGFDRGRAEAGLFGQGGSGDAARLAPGLDAGSDRHGAHCTERTPGLAMKDAGEDGRAPSR